MSSLNKKQTIAIGSCRHGSVGGRGKIRKAKKAGIYPAGKPSTDGFVKPLSRYPA